MQRIVIALSPENTVQYYKFDNESDEWEDDVYKIGNAISKVHSETKLAAGFTATKANIIYQDTEGKLGYASTSDGVTWAHGGTLPAVNPVPGTPLATINLQSAPEALRVYYISASDASAHYLELSESGNTTGEYKQITTRAIGIANT